MGMLSNAATGSLVTPAGGGALARIMEVRRGHCWRHDVSHVVAVYVVASERCGFLTDLGVCQSRALLLSERL